MAANTTLTPEQERELAELEELEALERELQVPQAPDQFSSSQSALQGFGQGATLGYLPEAQAAVEPALQWAYEKVSGQDLGPSEDFPTRLKKWRAREQGIKQEDPGAYLAGAVPGAITTSAIPGAVASRGVSAGVKGTQGLKALLDSRKIGAVALGGATQGALVNPEVDGDLLTNLKARGTNALVGGALGGSLQGLSKAAQGIPKAAQSVKESLALRQMGAMKKDLKNILKKDQVEGLETFMKNEGLMRPGSTAETVYEESQGILSNTGKKIGETYQKVSSAAENATTPEQLTQVLEARAKMNPINIADEFLEQAKLSAKGKSGGQQALSTVENELVNLKSLGDDASIEDIFAYRQSLDDNIKYNKTYSESPASQKALRDLRTFVQKRVDSHIDELDNLYSTKNTKLLKELNKRYSQAATVKTISQDKVAGEQSKMILGLPELIAGGAVAGGSAATSGNADSDSAVKGLLAAAAFKGARKFGPAVGYQMANTTQALSTPIAKGLEKIPANAGRLTAPWLLMQNKER